MIQNSNFKIGNRIITHNNMIFIVLSEDKAYNTNGSYLDLNEYDINLCNTINPIFNINSIYEYDKTPNNFFNTTSLGNLIWSRCNKFELGNRFVTKNGVILLLAFDEDRLYNNYGEYIHLNNYDEYLNHDTDPDMNIMEIYEPVKSKFFDINYIGNLIWKRNNNM